MSIQLIAIDIDGTLLTTKKELTERVKAAIRRAREKGVYIVLCTGRPLPGVTSLLQELDLVNDRDFVITYNGSMIQQTGNGAILAEFSMSYEDLERVAKYAEAHGLHYHAIDHEAIYVPTEDIGYYSQYESELTGMPIAQVSLQDIPSDKTFTKMMYIEQPELLAPFVENLPKELTDHYTLLRSAPFYLEVLHPKASKGQAVATLAAHLGFEQSQVMCIGDNENDLDMIEYAGIGVAMGNAVDSVKSVANHITATNDEHGVALAIEQFIS